MIRTVALLVDRQRSPEERLRVAGAVSVPEQYREFVEVHSRRWDGHRAVAFLIDRQRAPEERLRLGGPVSDPQQFSDVSEVGPRRWVWSGP